MVDSNDTVNNFPAPAAQKTNSRGRGRPRLYPDTETATDRVNRSVENLLKKGGSRRTFRLSPEAKLALDELRVKLGKNDDTAVINDVLIKAHKSQKQKN